MHIVTLEKRHQTYDFLPYLFSFKNFHLRIFDGAASLTALLHLFDLEFNNVI